MQTYTEPVIRFYKMGFRLEDAVSNVWFILMNNNDRQEFENLLNKSNPVLVQKRVSPEQKFFYTCLVYLRG